MLCLTIARKTRNRNVLRAPEKKKKKFDARITILSFLANASENDHDAPKARYDCAPCCYKMLSTVLFCVFPLWRLLKPDCWSRAAGPVKNVTFIGRCIALTTNECHSFAVKHAWDYKRAAVRLVGSARKPGSESIRRVSVWSSSQNQTRDQTQKMRPRAFLVGSKTYKPEVKASDVLFLLTK